jgi:hypothetical protein
MGGNVFVVIPTPVVHNLKCAVAYFLGNHSNLKQGDVKIDYLVK